MFLAELPADGAAGIVEGFTDHSPLQQRPRQKRVRPSTCVTGHRSISERPHATDACPASRVSHQPGMHAHDGSLKPQDPDGRKAARRGGADGRWNGRGGSGEGTDTTAIPGGCVPKSGSAAAASSGGGRHSAGVR